MRKLLTLTKLLFFYMINRDDKDDYFKMFIKGTEIIYYFYEVPDTEQVLNNKADNEEEG